MAYIEQRGSSYRVHVSLGRELPRIRITCPTLTEARALARELEKTKRRAVLNLDDGRPEISLVALAAEFYSHRKNDLAPGTCRVYLSRFKILLAVLGHLDLHRITIRELRLYSRDRLKVARQSTVNAEFNVLSGMLRFAKDMGYRVPADLKMPRARVPKLPPAYLSKAEALRVIETAAGVWRVLLAVAVTAGLREQELAWLTWDDIDLGAGVIRVRAKRDGEETWYPKNRRARNVPLTDEIAPLLARHPRTGRWVFTLDGEHRISHFTIGQNLTRIGKEAGVALRVNTRMLRHTFASHRVEDGYSLKFIGEMMGHSATSTTEIYSHLDAGVLGDTARRYRIGLGTQWVHGSPGLTKGDDTES